MQSTRCLVSFVFACMVSVCTVSWSQTPQNEEADWQSKALPRLRAIYEDGRMGATPFRGRWLQDGDKYAVPIQDSNRRSGAEEVFESATGESADADVSEGRSNKRMRSPDGSRVLEFRDRSLVVRHLATGDRERVVTREKDRDISYRDPSWSPDGEHVLFVESDSTDVRYRSMLVPSDPTYPGVRESRFARVGETIASVRVGVVGSDGGDVEWLSLDLPDEGVYLGQVAWAGNSNQVIVEVLSRFRRDREIFLFDLGGQRRSLYQESNDAWAVGSHGINSGLEWIEDGKAFVVISEKDGWRHAFIYERDGAFRCLLTQGDYDIIDRAAIDEDGGWYYFYASPEDGTRKYLYRVPLAGSGDLQRVTPQEAAGTHEYDISPNGKYAFHTFSDIDTPPTVELVQLEGHRVIRRLEENSELKQRVEQLASPATEFVQLDIGDGVVMDASLMKPTQFDASRKYPVFVYVYGEPYSQTVLDRWGAAQSHFHRVVADMGYVVVSIDNRGTPCPKGAAWRRSIYGSLGPLSTADQAAGLRRLGEMRPYLDLSRVGIWGWSGGGSNTLNAMFRKPGLYDVGIAVVPKPQPHLYNAWFQEIYMQTRETNPEGYKRAAPLNFAEGLEGKLLMITGSGETNTHIQIIEGLVDRLIELGKPFDYMVYPNRNHGLREGRGTEVHVRMLILRYLIDNLPAGAA